MGKEKEYLIEFKNKLQQLHSQNASSYRAATVNADNADLREWLNRAIPLATAYVVRARQSPRIHYAPPPAVGGLTGEIDLLANLFNLGRLQIPVTMVYDLIDRAIGVYEYQDSQKWKNWINPLYWIGEIIRFPFGLLRFAGFDGLKFEASWFGKFYKLIIGLIAVVVSIFELYNFLKPFLK